MRPWSRILAWTAVFAARLVLGATAPGTAVDIDRDGIPDAVEEKLGSPTDVRQQLVPVATSPDNQYTPAQAAVNAPDILSLEGCHVGGGRVLFRIEFAAKPDFRASTFVLYTDLDNDRATGRTSPGHEGTDFMASVSGGNVRGAYHNSAYTPGNTVLAGALDGRQLLLAIDAPVEPQDGFVRIGVHLLCQRTGGRSDSTRHTVTVLPFQADVKLPARPAKSSSDLRSLADYRFYNDVVKLEPLADKGLTRKQVTPAEQITFARPRPPVPFSPGPRKPGHGGSVEKQEIEIGILEEAGVGRKATPLTFGFPLAQGTLFDTANMRLLDAGGTELPAQITPTAFWPDDSLKWVLVDSTLALNAGQQTSCRMEFGNRVSRHSPASQLKVDETEETIRVVTGPMEAVIDTKRFNLFGRVWVDRDGDGKFRDDERVAASARTGIRLIDEKGELFTTAMRPPDSVTVEQTGPRKAVVRVAGKYGARDGRPYMDYIVRFTFRERSSRVEVMHTHIDTYLETEFTDITSLSMPFEAEGGPHLSVFQADDQHVTIRTAEGTEHGERHSGATTFGAAGRRVGVAVHEWWQRWPKGFEADGTEFVVGILPKQPSTDYGKDLPHYLLYPLCEGKYRFKWGMAFSTRMTLDFSGRVPEAELLADANRPIVPVLPATWYASTKALGPCPAPLGKQFAQWDAFVADCYAAGMESKARNREYGYLNYGDWWGERGRNWGNNEYDHAHGFIMQFARTGNRDYFRLAQAAARHQADVDIVHAYPDPKHVGANYLHSIAHTGVMTQTVRRAQWSHRYGWDAMASNGHTWAQGMVETWYLTGDARIMEGVLELGEHVAWSMAPSFTQLGTHERSAGWSLNAIMAIYHATLDPEYLRAARQIAAVALREQKFDQGGAWPHRLPGDHARGVPNAVGNNLFLIGVLLNGLHEYYAVSQDPAVRKSLVAGMRWVADSWDAGASAWPYSAGPNSEPYGAPTSGVNNLLMASMAAAGRITGEDRFYEIAEAALVGTLFSGPVGFGKSIAQKLVFAPKTLYLLQQWHAAKRPDKGIRVLDGSAEDRLRFLVMTVDVREHTVRGPDRKIFHVRADAAPATLVLTREKHGAIPKSAPTGTVTITDGADNVVRSDTFDTDKPWTSQVPLEPAVSCRVVVDDDMRSKWSLSGKGVRVVMEAVPQFHIAAVGRRNLYFRVPHGTMSFAVRLVGVHTGGYGCAVISPSGKLVAHHEGVNVGHARLPRIAEPDGQGQVDHPERATIDVRPQTADTGNVWRLVVHAAGDLQCELDGVPPYLALSRDDLFVPR